SNPAPGNWGAAVPVDSAPRRFGTSPGLSAEAADDDSTVATGDGGPLPHDFGLLANELRRATLAADGTVRLCGLPEQALMVGIDVGGQWYGRFADVERQTTTEVEFELGTAALFGSIFTEEREPASGALIRVAHRGSGVTCGVASAEDGSYCLERLAPGPYWLSVMLDGDRWSDGEFHLQLAFEAGELRRRDFGPSPVSEWLSGSLLDRAGDRVELFGRSAARLSFSNTATGDQRSVAVEVDGSFEIALEAGTYRVHVEHSNHWEPVPLDAALVMPAGGLEQDFVLPGTTVRGSLTGPVGGGPRGARAHPAGERAPAVFRQADSNDGRTYAFFGLPPGRWRLGAYGQPLDGFTDLEIRPTDTVLELDLTRR
ncbi:MAG: carboxypeptidase-like regulatory domain-containing protein, partial [Planctomycetota bacterium]